MYASWLTMLTVSEATQYLGQKQDEYVTESTMLFVV